MGKWRRAQDMAAPVLTISFSTSDSRVRTVRLLHVS